MAKVQGLSVEKTSDEITSQNKETFIQTKVKLEMAKSEAHSANTVLSGLIVLSDKISVEMRAKIMKTKIAFSEVAKSIDESRELVMKDHKIDGKLNEEKFFETYSELLKERITINVEPISNEEFDILLAVNAERKITSSQLEILMIVFDKIPK